jgi:hypothetical protein
LLGSGIWLHEPALGSRKSQLGLPMTVRTSFAFFLLAALPI